MKSNDDVKKIVLDCLLQNGFPVGKDEDFAKIDILSHIGSLALVNLIMDIEDEFLGLGNPIRIVTDSAFSHDHSPFRTVQTLIDYIGSLV